MKTMQKVIPIKDVVIDQELYPRSNQSGVWQTIVNYAEAMKTGAQFPPIAVAYLDGKYYLVDGNHRLKANKLNKETHITAEILTGLTRPEIFMEAVKRNVSHGLILSYYDKLRAVQKLKEYGISPVMITEIVQMRPETITRSMGKRMVVSSTGQEVILKNPMKHLSGSSLLEMQELNTINDQMSGESQLRMLEDFASLLRNGMMNMSNPRVKKLVGEIKSLLLDL